MNMPSKLRSKELAVPITRQIVQISRRAAVKIALAIPLSTEVAHGMQPASSAAPSLAAVVHDTEAQARAFMQGDMTRWLDLVRIAGDFTLMQPFGGEASHSFDASPERMARLARYFRNGDASIEIAQCYASDDFIVIAMIERQHGEVGGLPNQDWSLRVTQVYRRQNGQWWLVHRDADPLVRHVGLETAAALARGDRWPKAG